MQTESTIDERNTGIHWVNTTFISLFHIGAVAALFFPSWQAISIAVFLYWLAGSLGIGMGYHRLLTHRGLKLPSGLSTA
jgi:stearoyl-CoA desaturase (delta-9 desaturase)